MKKNIILCLIALAVLLSLQACRDDDRPRVKSNEPPLRFGFMICDSYELSKERFAPYAAYMGEKLGRDVEMILVNTYDFEDLIRDEKVDFFHVNSVVAVILKEKYDAEFLVVDKQGRHGHKATGTLIARKDSGIKTIDDMRGKTLVFGPALAPFGYMAQYALMLEHGFDPEIDLARYVIPPGSLKHDKIIYSIEYGKYDIGAAPRIDLDRMVDEDIINIDDYHIIAESETMPYCTIGAAKHVDTALQQRVKELSLNITHDETALVDGEVLKVLRRMGLDGFAPAIDSEYDSIREKLKLANMPPYSVF